MFVVTLTYQVPLSAIDDALPEHGEWLERNYADGVFVLSGRQVPRTGGVILAAGVPREELDRRLAEDPFQQRGYATSSVVEVEPTRVADALTTLLPR